MESFMEVTPSERRRGWKTIGSPPRADLATWLGTARAPRDYNGRRSRAFRIARRIAAQFEDRPCRVGDKEDVMATLGTTSRNRLPAADVAEPETRAYPIADKPHARIAKARAIKAVKAGRMSKTREAKIESKADAVSKKG
jgi:hypothetical protein